MQTQFYNDPGAFETCDSLVTKDTKGRSNSVTELISVSNIPSDKLVIGKPLRKEDSNGAGWMDPAVMATCPNIGQAGGFMFWQWRPVPSTTLEVEALKLLTG